MNKGILVKSIVEFIEVNGVEDEVRFLLNEKAAKREQMPFELHYSDGYRSWFFEKNKVVDAFYFGGYLVSVSNSKAVGYYDDASQRVSKVKIGGKSCQIIPLELCRELHKNLQEINTMLSQICGDSFSGDVWVQSENNHLCFNFSSGKSVQRKCNSCELLTRAVVAL